MTTTDAERTQTAEQDAEQGPTTSEFRALKERVTEVEAENDRLRDRVDELEQQTEQNENATDYAHERVDDLDATVDRGLEYAHERIDAFAEGGFEDVNTMEKSATDSRNSAASPLKQITDLPQYLAEEQLSANQKRARSIATDLADYADTGTPKGWVIDSGTISKVLAAQEGESPHTETVSRTMDFLDGFGKSEVETKMHKGRRIAVFDEQAAKRYGSGTIDPSQCGVIRARGGG
jgi:hypothetical protein